ncbi:MAG: pseudouridine synthase [Myxococcales bacterium]
MSTSARPPTPSAELRILGEYRGLLFVDKPAGLQTEPDVRTSDTLLSRLATQLGEPVSRLHALSRLDTGVSGVVTIGLSADARRLVEGWREQGRFARRYLALANGVLGALPRTGAWSESIGRAAGSLRAVSGRNAESAHTDYALVESSALHERAQPSQVHLLALGPRTGRTHQLRVHCAAHALPLLGDRGYGGASRLTLGSGAVRALDRIALHAAWVELPLPQPLRIEAATPSFLLRVWADFGGAEAAFEVARRVALGAPIEGDGIAGA